MLSDKKKKKWGDWGLAFLLHNKIGKFPTHSIVKVTFFWIICSYIWDASPYVAKLEKI